MEAKSGVQSLQAKEHLRIFGHYEPLREASNSLPESPEVTYAAGTSITDF